MGLAIRGSGESLVGVNVRRDNESTHIEKDSTEYHVGGSDFEAGPECLEANGADGKLDRMDLAAKVLKRINYLWTLC